MMRWITAFTVVLLAAGTARADGFVKLSIEIANRPHAQPQPQATTGPAGTSAKAADAARSTPAQPVNLDPTQLAGHNQRLDLIYHPTSTRSETRHQGVTLPYDGDWRVQAAEVGAMVGVFAALVAICGDGKCMW